MNELLKDENISLLEIADKQIYLVGTAHVSQSSVDLVEKAIKTLEPDTVAVELCESRHKALKDPNRWKNLDLFEIIKKKQGTMLLAQLFLTSYQKKIAKDLNIQPGAEMMKALELAKEEQASIVLADRDIKTTLKRTWSNLSFWNSLKMTGALIGGIFSNQQISEEEIEKLKTKDALEEAMKEFAEQFPDVRESLIDERDKYLAEKIRTAPGEVIVAVVGAGHVPGIKNYIQEPRNLKKLEEIPPPGKTGKMIGWGLSILFLAVVTYLFMTAGTETAVDAIYVWFIVNSLAAAIGALITLAHPITILVAAIASPFTSTNPLISVGIVAALTETYLRKPKVKDLENITEDISSYKTAVNNSALRVLMVLFITNVFGGLATLAAPWIALALASS